MEMDKAFEIIRHKLEKWHIELIGILPNFIVAVIALIIFIVFAKILRKTILKVLFKASQSESANRLISNIIYFFVILLGIMVALSFLKLDGTVNKMLAGAGIIGLGISFAFQDIIANVFSGAVITIKRIIKPGDIIETGAAFGRVHTLGLRTVELHNFDGQVIIIPSKTILQNQIINYTATDKRRIVVKAGISYSADLPKVREITLAAVKNIEGILTDEPIEFYYTEFGDSSIDFIARFWIRYTKQPDYFSAVSEAIISIKTAFDKNGISIPFPIRTLDFGDKKNIKLNEFTV